MKSRAMIAGLAVCMTASMTGAAVATSVGAQAANGAGTLATNAAGTPAAKRSTQHVRFVKWSTNQDFMRGINRGTAVARNQITLKNPVGVHKYTDPFGHGRTRSYDYATWTSPVVKPGFNLTELVSSWNADTPPGTWIEVDMRGKTDLGTTSKWYIMGRWTADDPKAAGPMHRTSVPSQGDQIGYVSIDTFVASNGHSLSNWQLRVTLNRVHGSFATPAVRLVGAMASRISVPRHVPASPLGGAEGITLDVPTYSQEIHRGQYPQWDNGGEAWCSPTSTSMVVAYWNRGPTPFDYRWVDKNYADPWVDYAARNTYDYNYDGAGNWPFNTAYAARYGLQSFVTRLRSLTEAEQFIKAGIPVVVSVSFKKGDLDGAGYGTSGHLMVIVGFTRNGDVVVNDPASHLIPSDKQVRTVYDREQFENTWIPHSGGIVYIIHPGNILLPKRPHEANW